MFIMVPVPQDSILGERNGLTSPRCYLLSFHKIPILHPHQQCPSQSPIADSPPWRSYVLLETPPSPP